MRSSRAARRRTEKSRRTPNRAGSPPSFSGVRLGALGGGAEHHGFVSLCVKQHRKEWARTGRGLGSSSWPANSSRRRRSAPAKRYGVPPRAARLTVSALPNKRLHLSVHRGRVGSWYRRHEHQRSNLLRGGCPAGEPLSVGRHVRKARALLFAAVLLSPAQSVAEADATCTERCRLPHPGSGPAAAKRLLRCLCACGEERFCMQGRRSPGLQIKPVPVPSPWERRIEPAPWSETAAGQKPPTSAEAGVPPTSACTCPGTVCCCERGSVWHRGLRVHRRCGAVPGR
jgi:hypothetical protein